MEPHNQDMYLVVTGRCQKCGKLIETPIPAWSPLGQVIWDKPGRDYPSEFSSIDTHDYDFDADQEFIVYSKAEVMGMIRVLLFALADGKVDNMAWSSVAGGDSLREDIG